MSRTKPIWNKGKITSDEIKLKLSLAHLGKHHTEKTKDKISKLMKGHFGYMLGKHHTEETKRKISISLIGKTLGRKHTEEVKRKQSLAKIGKPSNNKGHKYPIELYPNMGLRKTRKNIIIPIKDTRIEVKIQNFLKQLGIEFLTHQYMKDIEHGYQCDILIPSINLVIECDGNYWHKYPIGRDIDKIRTSELINQGFKVLRLWENEINIMNLNAFQVRLNIQ